MTVTNQNRANAQMKGKLNSGNACYRKFGILRFSA